MQESGEAALWGESPEWLTQGGRGDGGSRVRRGQRWSLASEEVGRPGRACQVSDAESSWARQAAEGPTGRSDQAAVSSSPPEGGSGSPTRAPASHLVTGASGTLPHRPLM